MTILCHTTGSQHSTKNGGTWKNIIKVSGKTPLFQVPLPARSGDRAIICLLPFCFHQADENQIVKEYESFCY
jgi:hypothetical protein